MVSMYAKTSIVFILVGNTFHEGTVRIALHKPFITADISLHKSRMSADVNIVMTSSIEEFLT